MRVDSRQELSPCSLAMIAMIAKSRHVDRAAKFVVAMIDTHPTQPAAAIIDTQPAQSAVAMTAIYPSQAAVAFFARDRHHSHTNALPGHPAQPTPHPAQPTVAFFAHERTRSHAGSHTFADPGHPAQAAPQPTPNRQWPAADITVGVDDTGGTVSGLVPTSTPFQGDSGVLRSTQGRTRRRIRLSRSYPAPWDKL